MLVTMKEILDDARARQYGVGFFNTFNVELAMGVIEGAEALKAPVIIGTAEALLGSCDMRLCTDMLRFIAKRSTVPVAVHLDHGFSASVMDEALDAGFTSVMYDRSELPYDENVKLLRDLTDRAHARDISVEGELGHVVFDTTDDTGYAYTQPQDVCDFVERTGVDALAIAIGTAHGLYKEKPVLDLARLRAIRAITDAALVLHGGSGLSDEDFRNCVRDGIQKVNIYTDVSFAASQAAHDYVEAHNKNIHDVSIAMREAVRDATITKLKLFSCAGKA
ncbi:MAG: class II fructose-bisphosphate aldolase [Clostridia bacterium]